MMKKKKQIEGAPPFWPLEVQSLEKWPPLHYLWPHFFISESFATPKIGIFAKNRAQYVKNWPRYEKQIRKFGFFFLEQKTP